MVETVNTLVIVRYLLFLLGKRQAGYSLLELGTANFDNQVLTILNSGKETRVTQVYGKNGVKVANIGTEAAEESTKLLIVSMPLAMFKRPITIVVCQI